MSEAMLHPGFETLSPREIRASQAGRWQKQWSYVRSQSVFYKEKLGRAAPDGLPLHRLQDLPFTEKDELRQSQERYPPFGDTIACAPEKVVRVHRTSGTTG